MGDGNQSFKERTNLPNTGEQLFMAHCDRVGATYWHIGFDEKRTIPGFYHLAAFLRHLPDFVVHNPKTGKTVVVEVKGTLNYKTSDYERLAEYSSIYGSPQSPYLIAFCINNQVTWQTPKQVIDAYEWSTTVGQWSDGVKYRTLTLA